MFDPASRSPDRTMHLSILWGATTTSFTDGNNVLGTSSVLFAPLHVDLRTSVAPDKKILPFLSSSSSLAKYASSCPPSTIRNHLLNQFFLTPPTFDRYPARFEASRVAGVIIARLLPDSQPRNKSGGAHAQN